MDPALDALCPGCFADKGAPPDRANPCPHCGYDEVAPRPPLLLPHRTLLAGNYLIGRVLGRPGGFGVTYLGWDQHLARRVAIKEFLPRELAGRGPDQVTVVPHSQEDAEVFRHGLAQFQREARTLAQLDHPNIVRVMQVLEANGTAYLVMEYYEGLTLAEYLTSKGERLPAEDALALLRPMLDGLAAVHAKGFLHRDIKPQNVYLARTEHGGTRPILLDFGAARQAVGERSQSVSILGTPGYAPFEQYNSRDQQGTWTDVYAAAAVLYRMVTGATPPPSGDRMAGAPLRPATSFGVPAALSEALDRALALAPGERPQTLQALIATLWPITGPEPPPPPPPPTPENKRVVWPWVLLLLAGVGALWAWQYNETERRHQDDLAFAAAEREGTASAFRTYLAGCVRSGCGHHAAAEAALERLDPGPGGQTPAVSGGVPPSSDGDDGADPLWDMARTLDTEQGYQQYLDTCAPTGCRNRALAETARERKALARERDALARENLRAETARRARDDADFEKARSKDNSSAYRAYLDNCEPNGCAHRDAAEGAWRQAARAERDALQFAVARYADSADAWNAYLDGCHENGCGYAPQARKRLAELDSAAAAERARQAEEERRRNAPVAALRAYFGQAAAGNVDAALSYLATPKDSSRRLLENLSAVVVNEARLETISWATAQVFLDWTGTLRKPRKRERYRGSVSMIERDGTWLIESFGALRQVE